MDQGDDIPPGIRDESRRTLKNPVAGDKGTVLKYSYETNGQYPEAIVDYVPGGGPPVHFHRTYDERLTAMEGDLMIQIGNNEIRHIKVGEVVMLSAGTLHRFSAGLK
ncbi:hypothetical protein DOTSEDRAFT_22253 [Dothistroma septosporum NZE10]|uniref:Uncharacterized protein n=1 Tax=Dothistroma septosporum (strain NZE10 / CBS 128990) TaxID=675120 RepID=N1PT76_DOTSN|nr:hypothetical protein DOTSEDRAFT_22253 [Dothistroma septosporum NZE10]